MLQTIYNGISRIQKKNTSRNIFFRILAETNKDNTQTKQTDNTHLNNSYSQLWSNNNQKKK